MTCPRSSFRFNKQCAPSLLPLSSVPYTYSNPSLPLSMHTHPFTFNSFNLNPLSLLLLIHPRNRHPESPSPSMMGLSGTMLCIYRALFWVPSIWISWPHLRFWSKNSVFMCSHTFSAHPFCWASFYFSFCCSVFRELFSGLFDSVRVCYLR